MGVLVQMNIPPVEIDIIKWDLQLSLHNILLG